MYGHVLQLELVYGNINKQMIRDSNHEKVIARIQDTKNSSGNCSNNFVNIQLQKDFINFPGETLLNNLAT